MVVRVRHDQMPDPPEQPVRLVRVSVLVPMRVIMVVPARRVVVPVDRFVVPADVVVVPVDVVVVRVGVPVPVGMLAVPVHAAIVSRSGASGGLTAR